MEEPVAVLLLGTTAWPTVSLLAPKLSVLLAPAGLLKLPIPPPRDWYGVLLLFPAAWGVPAVLVGLLPMPRGLGPGPAAVADVVATGAPAAPAELPAEPSTPAMLLMRCAGGAPPMLLQLAVLWQAGLDSSVLLSARLAP